MINLYGGERIYIIYIRKHKHHSSGIKKFLVLQKNKIICFSAPFDLKAVKILKDLNCPIYKIASPEIEDEILIENIAKIGKPVIISTGIASEQDIKKAVGICKKHKNNKIILLNCISSYPASNKELNLNHIDVLKNILQLLVILIIANQMKQI